MKNREKVIPFAIALAIFAPTYSFAADAIVEQPVIAPAPAAIDDWTGFYLGGSVGWGKANTDGIFDSADTPPNRVDLSLFDLEGATGTIHVGYNYQLNNSVVVGVEGDWSFMDWSETRTDPDGGPDEASFDINWIASVRGRLGLTFNNNDSMIYGTVGAAWQDASYTACNCSAGPTETGTVDFNKTGLVVGGGLETKITPAFSIRAEGLYYHWDDRKDTSTLIPPESDAGDFAEIQDSFQFRIGGSFHF